MNWTLVLLVFVVWSTFHVFAAADLKLSRNSATPEYDRPFTLVCTVTGDTQNEAMKFVRNTDTICKRYAYNYNNQTKTFQCAVYYNTAQGYECKCEEFDANKKVYSVAIKSFKPIDATRWTCLVIKNNENIVINSDVVHLYVDPDTTTYSTNTKMSYATSISNTSTTRDGSSTSFTPENQKTSKTKELVGDPRSNPVLIPAVSAACGTVIVLVVIVVAVYIIKKRRNSRQHGTMDIGTDGRNYAKQNNTKERKEPVMKENELYFMSRDSPQHRRKPVMIDNDIYTLGNGDEELHVKPEDVGDMYSVVNKHGKTKGDHLQKLTEEEISAMYAVVKKDAKSVGDTKGKDTRSNEKREDNELAEDMSDMYTQVIKNKTKNKK